MIYSITQELASALKRQGVPFPAVYGPERSDSIVGRNRVVIEEDPAPGKDGFVQAPRGTHPNPRMAVVLQISCVCRVYAQSSIAGAAIQDHKRIARQVLDHVISELDVIAQTRRNTWHPLSGGFIIPDDIAGSNTWSGVVYEFRFAWDRGVTRKTWAGEARPTSTLFGVSTTGTVTLDNTEFEAIP